MSAEKLNTRMPVIFVGHGSPMNAIEDSEFNKAWCKLAKNLPTPKAILCISAHWETSGISVTSAEYPETIHDFGGFPQELHDVEYAVKGDQILAQRIAGVVTLGKVHLEDRRGLDHGSWGVLLPMYPDADIPVVQLSLNRNASNTFHYELGKQLAPFRNEGVLIICSGNIVHNLRMFDFRDPKPYGWAVRFNEQVKEAIITEEYDDLIDYDEFGQEATLSVPTPEHFQPLLYALGAKQADDKVSFFNDSVISSISMTSVIIQ